MNCSLSSETNFSIGIFNFIFIIIHMTYMQHLLLFHLIDIAVFSVIFRCLRLIDCLLNVLSVHMMKRGVCWKNRPCSPTRHTISHQLLAFPHIFRYLMLRIACLLIVDFIVFCVAVSPFFVWLQPLPILIKINYRCHYLTLSSLGNITRNTLLELEPHQWTFQH